MKEHYITALAAADIFVHGACSCGYVFMFRSSSWVNQYAYHRSGQDKEES